MITLAEIASAWLVVSLLICFGFAYITPEPCKPRFNLLDWLLKIIRMERIKTIDGYKVIVKYVKGFPRFHLHGSISPERVPPEKTFFTMEGGKDVENSKIEVLGLMVTVDNKQRNYSSRK